MKNLLYLFSIMAFLNSCCHCKVKESPVTVCKIYLQESDEPQYLFESQRFDSTGKILEKVHFLENGLTAYIYRYFYDSLNRLVMIRRFIPESKSTPFGFSTFTYNKAGLKISSISSGINFGDTSFYTYEYNSHRKLIRTTATSNQKAVQILSMWTGVEEYNYDRRDSLVSIWKTISNSTGMFLSDSIVYNGNEIFHYSYDSSGNKEIKTSIYKNGVLVKETENYREVNYKYDDQKRIIRKEDIQFHEESCIVSPNPHPQKWIYTYYYE